MRRLYYQVIGDDEEDRIAPKFIELAHDDATDWIAGKIRESSYV